MWKFILANFPFPIWFNDNPYLLARFFSEQLNGATIHALQADKSGEHMDDMEQIRKQQGHVSLATECRQEDTKNLRPCDAQPASTVPTRMLLLSAWEVHGDGFFLNDHDHEFLSGGSRCCWVIISFTPVLEKGLALHTLAKRAKGGLQLFARVWLGPWPFLFFPSFSSHAAFSLIRLAVIAFIMSSVLVGRQLTFLTGVFCTKHGCFCFPGAPSLSPPVRRTRPRRRDTSVPRTRK